MTYPPEGLGAELPPLLEMAEAQNPELLAASEERAAAFERVQPAGALPDPTLNIELRDIPKDSPTLWPADVGSTRYQIRQTFPLWGKRELRAATAGDAADSAQARREAVRLEVRAKVKAAYARFYMAQREYEIADRIVWLAYGLQDIAEARYGVGLAPQQDVVKAQLERWTLVTQLTGLDAERHHASGQINTLLGRQPEDLLALPKALPPVPDKPLRPYLIRQAMLEHSPLLADTQAQLKGAQSNEELVRRNRYPDLTVGAGPVQKGGSLGGWEMMFEVGLPLQRETRRAQEREAAALKRAAEARRQALQNELQNRLNEYRIIFETLTLQRTMLTDTLLPQAELAYQSALAGYQAGKVDFAAVLDAQRQLHKVRLDQIKAEVDQYLQWVEIERLTGEQ